MKIFNPYSSRINEIYFSKPKTPSLQKMPFFEPKIDKNNLFVLMMHVTLFFTIISSDLKKIYIEYKLTILTYSMCNLLDAFKTAFQITMLPLKRKKKKKKRPKKNFFKNKSKISASFRKYWWVSGYKGLF